MNFSVIQTLEGESHKAATVYIMTGSFPTPQTIFYYIGKQNAGAVISKTAVHQKNSQQNLHS